MLGFPTTKKRRRQEVRKQRLANAAPLWRRVSQLAVAWPVVAALVFAVAATSIVLSGRRSLNWVAGQTIHQPITAQVPFSFEDSTRLDQLRQRARAETPSFYRTNTKPIDDVTAELRHFYEAGKAAENFEAFTAAAEGAGWTVSQRIYDELRRLADDAGGQRYNTKVEKLRSAMADEYTALPRVNEGRQPASTVEFVRVLASDSVETSPESEGGLEVNALDLIFTTQTRVLEGRASRLAEVFGYPLSKAVADMVLGALQSGPILQFDKARTEEAMLAAANAVGAVTVTYERGQPIIEPRSGDGLVLTDEHIALLRRHADAYRTHLTSDHPGAAELRQQQFLQNLGTAAIVTMLTLGLFAYVGQHQPRVLQVMTRTVALMGLILITMLIVRTIATRWGYQELLVAPVLAAGSIVAIAYDRRFALGVMVIATTLIVLAGGGDFGLMIMTVLGLAVTTLMLAEIRTRTRIIKTGLLAGLLVGAASLAFGLINLQEPGFALNRALWALGGVVVSATFVQATLPFIESAFGIATALTLLEWRDASRALLQRLAREAPGTYNHSLVLSTMAETACTDIGANGLRTAVGALYHDIGKIQKADYFAENQEAAISRHDKLSPTMSLLIIVGHVKDGLEMAKEYGLPRALHPFIAEHHGTTLVRFFHHAATEQQPRIASGKHDRQVAESEFRYPGPKPRSRETAVLMLCDSVEGAVRSLPEPTAGRIETIVHQIVTDRLNDGQFDDCDITLKELHAVEESLVKSLCRFYHGRVAYPKTEVAEKRQPEATSPGRKAEAG